ncbi:MAG TPA: N-6 DNA methylase, partial [Gemmatimonadaceae bacterium]
MRTLRHAAELLAAATTQDGLLALATMLGFDDRATPLDADARAALGVPHDIECVRLATERGARRALLICAPDASSLRALFTTLAAQLAARTSHVLWVLIGTCSDGAEVGIGCWSAGMRPPRVVALVARPAHVVASDAEALCALEAASAGEDLLVHARWCELLGRDALSRRFYRALEQRVTSLGRSLAGVPDADRAELALLASSRFLFLSFLEAKGWLNGERDFLVKRFDECMGAGGGFHGRVMLPLFFGTLNTAIHNRAPAARRLGDIPFLNGGLFTKTALERRHSAARFSDQAIGELFGGLLSAYRFTAREEEIGWSEVAIDPEMLGRAFEALMAARQRRADGAFFTPQPLVAHVADETLVIALRDSRLSESQLRSAMDGRLLDPDVAADLQSRLRGLTVLDPACGSGAFLVYLLERLTVLHRAAGDTRPVGAIRRDVLGRAIHGVDVNPTAVWLCELRLWLSVVIDCDETRMSAIPPLPNLDCNVRVGDALAGDGFSAAPSLVGPSAALMRLRHRYIRAVGPRKRPLRRALAREETRRALAAIDRELVTVRTARRELLLARRSPDLFGERLDRREDERRSLHLRAAALRRERKRISDGGALAFSFPSHFAHVHSRGGFDIVIGNPPWVRLHNIPAASRASLRSRFSTFRAAPWEPPHLAMRGRGFGAQVDLAALFVERSLGLAAARRGGTVALLVPAKLWRSLSGAGVRRLIASHGILCRVEDWTDAPCAFDAAVYPSVLVVQRDRVIDAPSTAVAVHRGALTAHWCAAAESLQFGGEDSASPWLLLPPDVRRAFDLLRERGDALGGSRIGHPLLGVKCGCNDAFLVGTVGTDADLAEVYHRGRRGTIERGMLRPLLRGDAVARWHAVSSQQAIIWTHSAEGTPLRCLPPAAARWFAPWRRRLRGRTDLRGAASWWMLFRTEAADASRPRVVWSDFGRAPRATILAAGDPTVPLNTCYVLPCDDPVDALALAALLNSPLAAAWLNAIAEPARGRWRRYLAWTMSLLPIPRDWSHARERLAPLAERALLGDVPSADELLAVACSAYHVRREDIAP